MSFALALEAAALIALAAGTLLTASPPGPVSEAILIALSALPMGIQSTAVRRLGVAGVATTVITSTLAEVVAGLVGQRGTERRASDSRGRTSLQAAVFLAYGAGAVLGAATDHLWHLRALWLPAAISSLAVLAVMTRSHDR